MLTAPQLQARWQALQQASQPGLHRQQQLLRKEAVLVQAAPQLQAEGRSQAAHKPQQVRWHLPRLLPEEEAW